jgi:hypothetical protein
MRLYLSLLASLVMLAPGLQASGDPHPHRVTILYDAFGGRPGLIRDWGFAALVEYGGKRILFDTGNNAEIFARNVRALGVDLRRLDFVVISHRHGDHTSGMSYLLRVNPHVKIYAPKEGFGVFGAALPSTFYRRDASLADSMRYFNGSPPEVMTFGTPWPRANIQWIDSLTEVAPGVTIISTVSQTPAPSSCGSSRWRCVARKGWCCWWGAPTPVSRTSSRRLARSAIMSPSFSAGFTWSRRPTRPSRGSLPHSGTGGEW